MPVEMEKAREMEMREMFVSPPARSDHLLRQPTPQHLATLCVVRPRVWAGQLLWTAMKCWVQSLLC